MSKVVVLGAGLGGTIMAYELREALGREHSVCVVAKGSSYSFVPSNPWVAVGWRSREAITVDLAPVMRRRGIEFLPAGAKRLHPAEKRLEMLDGSSVDYDYLVIATGPELAFDEVEGLGPERWRRSPLSTRSSPIRDRSSWGPRRALPASALPTNSPSSSTRRCAMHGCATVCR